MIGHWSPLISMSRWRLVSCRQSPLFLACFGISASFFREQFGLGGLRKSRLVNRFWVAQRFSAAITALL